ncbi:MAG: K(+)-transporting ATPase subunit C [Clostridium sp.]
MKEVLKQVKNGFIITVVFMVICGVLYPLALTGVSQLLFNDKANGSIIYVNSKAVGSELIGQEFTDSRFMKSRPSAVSYNTYTSGDSEYAGVASGSNNYAPSNPALVDRVKLDMDEFLKNNPTVKREDIPTDLLTASASGLDPHISPASADIQVAGISKATGISEKKLRAIVQLNTEGKTFGVFGEERVNVLKVNLEIAKELGIVEKK